MTDSSTSTKLGGKKIVIVEDDKFLGSLVSKKLISAGSAVTLVSKGEEAVSTIEQVAPDLVILDLLLPGMSGFDILKKIRHDDRFKKLPVIILSNLGEEKDIQQGKDLGVNDFLIKATVNMDEIADHIAKIL
jgi:DNA-binding response OmpR family regulator